MADCREVAMMMGRRSNKSRTRTNGKLRDESGLKTETRAE